MPNKYIPERLEIKYSNQITGSKSIKLINNNLLVNNPNPELIAVNQISTDKWIEFWQTLERIGLWDLEEAYEADCIIVMLDNEEYRQLNPERIEKVIITALPIFDQNKFENVKYSCVGHYRLKEGEML